MNNAPVLIDGLVEDCSDWISRIDKLKASQAIGLHLAYSYYFRVDEPLILKSGLEAIRTSYANTLRRSGVEGDDADKLRQRINEIVDAEILKIELDTCPKELNDCRGR